MNKWGSQGGGGKRWPAGVSRSIGHRKGCEGKEVDLQAGKIRGVVAVCGFRRHSDGR